MNKVHQKTRELIASLPDRDLPAVRHLLACEDCALNALESLVSGGEEEVPAPEVGSEEVLRHLGTFPPELLQAFRERLDTAEALLEVLVDLPAAERLSAVLREERFREPHLAELLLEKSLRAQPREARRSEEMARLAYAVALRSGARAGGEYSASLKVRACCLLGNALRLLGDLEAADRSFQVAARYFGAALDGPERRMFNEMVAHLRLAQGRVDEALALLGRAGALCEEDGDLHRQGICLAWAGLICLDHDEVERAAPLLARARIALEPSEEPALACRVRLGLALCQAASGRRDRAAWLIDEARTLYAQVGDAESLARFFWAEGKVAAQAGASQEALDLLLAARRRWIGLGRLQDAALSTLDVALVMARCRYPAGIHALIHELADHFPAHPATAGIRVALLAFEAVAREAAALESGEDLKKARSLAAAYVRRMVRGGPSAA